MANNDSLDTKNVPEHLDASLCDYTFERNESNFNAEAIGIYVTN